MTARRVPSRHLLHEVLEVVAALPLFVAAPMYRHRHLRWGATDDEVAAVLPGDELVPRSGFTATRAITIDAPPERVWPWIMQVGFGRAGFYSYDLLDNLGQPSADRVLPEWQDPHPGDLAAPMTSPATVDTSFTVRELERPRYVVWVKPDSTWAWVLTPLPGGRTRLVTRIKQHYPRRPATLLTVVLAEFGDFPMMRRMLLGIKRRAETSQPPVGQDREGRPSP